jgi:hypothetical protein
MDDMKMFRIRIFAALLLLEGSMCSHAFSDTRNEEIAECRTGEISTWSDGVDRHAIAAKLRFAYRHEGAPAWFERAQVEAMVTKAMTAWSPCGIPVEMLALDGFGNAAVGSIMVQWSEAGSRGNFGLANLGERTLSLGAKGFALLKSRNPSYDATQTLQMVISHEMGHFFGLMAHSRRCVDVLSYYHDGKGGKCSSRDLAGMANFVEYRHVLPTACDIQRCRTANGQPPR